MTPADLPGVVRVAAASFPDHFEDLACFTERLTLSSALCSVLELDGEVTGYLIAYPWPLGEIPPLNSLLGALPDCETIYLHDLALAPQARAKGWTRPAVERLARATEGRTIALVSVNDSQAFWRGQGFERMEEASLAAKLASYGPDAAYMVRRA